MKPTQTPTTNLKRTLPLLGALLFFSSLFLLSCEDLSEDDDDGPKLFSVDVFASDGTVADFLRPFGVTVASDGTVYVADLGHGSIHKITASGMVDSVIDGINGPRAIAVTSDGTSYVSDTSRHRILKITSAGVASTFAGSDTGADGFTDAQGTAARFRNPYGIAIDSDGNLYVADTDNHSIRKITPPDATDPGTVSTFAGDGTTAEFNSPRGITIDSDDNLYVADTGNHRIRKITAAGAVSTLAGSDIEASGTDDGQGTMAEFNNPNGIAVAPDGTIYVADTNNNSIRKIATDGTVTTIVKDLNGPVSIALSSDGSTAYIANTDSDQILKLSNPSRAGSAPLGITFMNFETGETVDSDITLAAGSTIDLTASSNIPGGDTPNLEITPADGGLITLDGVRLGTSSGTITVTATINGLKKKVMVTVTAP